MRIAWAAGAPAVSERRVSVLRSLARPVSAADRRRERLVALALAGCGVFLLAAFAIATIRDIRLPFDPVRDVGGTGPSIPAEGQRLAPYLTQRGLRPGTSFGAVLLAVPFVLLAVQALRTGTAARERRLAALSLAGATRGQLRRIAVLEGTRAAVLGGLLAGPAYVVLWLAVGVAPPEGARMLPRPEWALLGAWVVILGGLALGGALAAARATRPATVTPLGIVRRASRPTGLVSLVVAAAGLAAGVIGFLIAWHAQASGPEGPILLLTGILVVCLSGGAALVRLVARAAAGGGLVSAMAAGRLLADTRSPGRVAGALLAVGIAFGFMGSQTTVMLAEDYGSDRFFYFAGFGLAAAGACLACVVALSSLVVAANEQVLDGRRGIAVLVALAASPGLVVQVVRRQLLLTAVPPVLLGTFVVWWVPNGVILGWGPNLLGLPAVLLLAGGVVWLAAVLAARLVRPAVVEAAQPENLRAP